MRIVRFRCGEETDFGVWEGDVILPLATSPFDSFAAGEPIKAPAGAAAIPLAEVHLLPPAEPTKIVCAGLNYRTHAREMDMPLPAEPLIFLKPPSALIGPLDAVIMPAVSGRVDYEGELVAVIGRRLRQADPALAARSILGFTCGNDVTARDLQSGDGQWSRAKGFDTFAPVGPAVVTGVDPRDLSIETRVNGQVRQRDTTAQLIFSPAELVSYISGIMTLEPGDLVFTGTPAGIGPLAEGDIVEVEIGGIGRLENPVTT